MTKRKHSKAEIAASLARANEMAAQGKTQIEIADALGISVMTLHRWRKAPPTPRLISSAHAPNQQFEGSADPNERISELQLENSRLRRLVTDLLLERMTLEESIQAERPLGGRAKVVSR